MEEGRWLDEEGGEGYTPASLICNAQQLKMHY